MNYLHSGIHIKVVAVERKDSLPFNFAFDCRGVEGLVRKHEIKVLQAEILAAIKAKLVSEQLSLDLQGSLQLVTLVVEEGLLDRGDLNCLRVLAVECASFGPPEVVVNDCAVRLGVH